MVRLVGAGGASADVDPNQLRSFEGLVAAARPFLVASAPFTFRVALDGASGPGWARGVVLSVSTDATLAAALALVATHGGCVLVGDAAVPTTEEVLSDVVAAGARKAARHAPAAASEPVDARPQPARASLDTATVPAAAGYHPRRESGVASLALPPPTSGARELRGTDAGFVRQHGDAIAVTFEFNPPAVTIVGDATAEMLETLAASIIGHCITPERLSALRQRPTFERVSIPIYSWMASQPHPVHRLEIRHLYFEEELQSALALAFLDTWAQWPGWVPVCCDGTITVEQTLHEEAKAARMRALTLNQRKPEKPQGKYKSTSQFLFVFRIPNR